MKVINLTPHAVTLRGEMGDVTIPPSGFVARATATTSRCGTVEINGISIPLISTSYGELTVTNEAGETISFEDDTMYIVSSLAAQAASDELRRQLVIPSDFERDAQGRIVAARALARA